MNYYAIYNIATCEYIQHCSASELSEVLAICTAQQSAHQLMGETSIVDCYFDGEAPSPKGISPSIHHTFNWTIKQWQDPRTLQDLKAAKWLEIKQARSTAELGPFTFNAMTFDGDLNAQRRLAAYVSVSKSALAAGQAFAAEFTLANNTLVTLTAQDFVGIELAKVQSVAAAFARAARLRTQIETAETAEQVALIGW